MLYRLLLVLLSLAPFDAPARHVPRASDAEAQTEEVEAVADAPCFIFINEAGDVAERCE